MKTSFPLNLMPPGWVTCDIGNCSPYAAANKAAVALTNAIKQYLSAMRAVSPAIVMLFSCAIPPRGANGIVRMISRSRLCSNHVFFTPKS